MFARSIPIAILTALASLSGALRADDDALRSALTLFASFDHGPDADFAKGDDALYTWVDRDKDVAKKGMPTGGKSGVAAGVGRFGGALEFRSSDAPWLFYAGEGNLAFRDKNWSGSASIWMKCDPVNGLAPGYCDPVQLTPRKWDDAAFFLDFNKEGKPRAFRLGVFADREVWNPKGGEVAEAQRPLLTAKDPVFGAEKWTHVLFTWEGFNTGTKLGQAKLYIDGELNGTLGGWEQQFSWGKDETPRLLLGLHYVGLLDEFACFDRALSGREVKRIYTLKGGIGSLLKAADGAKP